MGKKKVGFAVAFVILAFGFMFADALFYLDQKSKPSMVLLHTGSNMEGMEMGEDNSMMMASGPSTSNDETGHASMETVQGCFGHHESNEDYETTLTHCKEDVCKGDPHCEEEIEDFATQLRGGPAANNDHSSMDMSMSSMDMDMSSMDIDMEGMIDINELPLEEPRSRLEPEIIFEDGKEIKVFKIWIEAIKKEIRPGVYVEAWGFNRQVPGPEIRTEEGDNVRVIFENRHDQDHTIHWHGLHVPTEMDGVPGISQFPVKPNETFVYEFVAGPSGTHSYHCHVDTDHHMDMGMYGAFIVEAEDENLSKYDVEETWVLSSFNTKRHPHSNTEKSPYFSGHLQYKVEKDAFLINGKAFPATEFLKVKEGDLVKLRLIHKGKEPYSMHIHGHSFKVTHKDGFKVSNPQEMDTIPILPGERYDIEIEMKNKGTWVFHDHITQHVTNDGFYPGGMLAIIMYEGIEIPEYLAEYLESIAEYNEKSTELGRALEKGFSSGMNMESMNQDSTADSDNH